MRTCSPVSSLRWQTEHWKQWTWKTLSLARRTRSSFANGPSQPAQRSPNLLTWKIITKNDEENWNFRQCIKDKINLLEIIRKFSELISVKEKIKWFKSEETVFVPSKILFAEDHSISGEARLVHRQETIVAPQTGLMVRLSKHVEQIPKMIHLCEEKQQCYFPRNSSPILYFFQLP